MSDPYAPQDQVPGPEEPPAAEATPVPDVPAKPETADPGIISNDHPAAADVHADLVHLADEVTKNAGGSISGRPLSDIASELVSKLADLKNLL